MNKTHFPNARDKAVAAMLNNAKALKAQMTDLYRLLERAQSRPDLLSTDEARRYANFLETTNENMRWLRKEQEVRQYT